MDLKNELTNQMNVYLSCHFAFLGSKTLEPTYAITPRASTPARENADVLVNMVGVSAMVWGEGKLECDGGRLRKRDGINSHCWPSKPVSILLQTAGYSYQRGWVETRLALWNPGKILRRMLSIWPSKQPSPRFQISP